MDGVELLHGLLRHAHESLAETMADVTPEQAHWLPPGKAIPLGALYAHIALGEDLIVSRVLRKVAPLHQAAWAGRTGLSELPPQLPPWEDWARRVRLDLPAVQAFAAAVFAATEAYVVALKPEDLSEQVDMGEFGGWWPRAMILGPILAGHVYAHGGEISCLKGLQGTKGYPY